MLTAGQRRQKLGLVDFLGNPFFVREVATKQFEQRVVQAWNSWAWAAKADSIEELTFHTDGAAELTEAWPRRVASAGWGAHRLWCAPCMMDGQFSTSAPSEPTAAAAVGLSPEEENSRARVRRVRWIADSTYALNVAGHKCKVNANAAIVQSRPRCLGLPRSWSYGQARQ